MASVSGQFSPVTRLTSLFHLSFLFVQCIKVRQVKFSLFALSLSLFLAHHLLSNVSPESVLSVLVSALYVSVCMYVHQDIQRQNMSTLPILILKVSCSFRSVLQYATLESYMFVRTTALVTGRTNKLPLVIP